MKVRAGRAPGCEPLCGWDLVAGMGGHDRMQASSPTFASLTYAFGSYGGGRSRSAVCMAASCDRILTTSFGKF